MNGFISILAIVAMLLAAGGAIALVRRGGVDWRWLLAAAGFVLLNDALLTRGYGLLPQLLPAGDWNWQGKILALAATLAVAAVVGRKAAGLTLVQARGSLKAALPVARLYVGLFLALALVFPNEKVSAETLAFQLTMPGLEEELFYRGVLLLVLDRAFGTPWKLGGITFGWGAILSCALFGLAHAFGYGKDGFAFDTLTMALTALPSLIAVWLRLRTGSVLAPVLLHNFGNAVMLVV
ncbi:CPBP family intramembrane metalloprotease [Caulobacter zeae]|uniref:CPBP family intramembrane metalloprotease n=1 Tax=Caulobacter zeae TaxID=2055137 RepID=A0A2N5DSE9_9CAUL|nr:CPBP family intramembrane glutamic endopeptidase [Caulobacter zeae]PLR28983.1 CPBP family intramembrane metalloprotease [Caulobacter zeae]